MTTLNERREIMKSIFLLTVTCLMALFSITGIAIAESYFVVAIDVPPRMMNPHGDDPDAGLQYMANFFDGLLQRKGKDGTLAPALAERWERLDQLTWKFYLRKGVKFHSGNPLTADDVVYSFQRVVILKDQPSFILTQFGITPDSVKAVDKYTVQITLDKKYAGGIFFACLSAGVASIVDSQVVKQHIQKTDKYPDGDMGLTWLTRNSGAITSSGQYVCTRCFKSDRCSRLNLSAFSPCQCDFSPSRPC